MSDRSPGGEASTPRMARGRRTRYGPCMNIASEERRRARVAGFMRVVAMRGVYDGRMESRGLPPYIRHCTYDDIMTGVRLIFSRDTGHHSSGWFKNPDYERCWHLSISPAPSPAEARLWLGAFFGDAVRLAWMETAKTPLARQRAVQHWRVFCDAEWAPIHPRGEVYSTEFTEKGWKSASEQGVIIESPMDPETGVSQEM